VIERAHFKSLLFLFHVLQAELNIQPAAICAWNYQFKKKTTEDHSIHYVFTVLNSHSVYSRLCQLLYLLPPQ